MSRNPEDIINFAPGPAKLPREVIVKAQTAVMNWEGTGIGVMELSHRSKDFEKILTDCLDTLRRLLKIPANYKILLLQGGGTAQFAAIPINLTQSNDEVADYFVTGQWSNKAAKEAEKYIKVNRVLPKTDKFTSIPEPSSWKLSDNASYVYYCDNETVHGVEFPTIPEVGDKLLVCDMSSNFLTRSFDVTKFGLIYAGAQKNVGCAGVTIVIVRDDLLNQPRKDCPIFLDYTVQVGMNSLYNTPCTWAIYILGEVLKWVENEGGVSAMQAKSAVKSQLVYDVIAESHGFYNLVVEPGFRSRVNVAFRAGPESERDKVESDFLKQATENGLIRLKGHRSVGGLRVSMYNALSVEEVKILVEFMRKFMGQRVANGI